MDRPGSGSAFLKRRNQWEADERERERERARGGVMLGWTYASLGGGVEGCTPGFHAKRVIFSISVF